MNKININKYLSNDEMYIINKKIGLHEPLFDIRRVNICLLNNRYYMYTYNTEKNILFIINYKNINDIQIYYFNDILNLKRYYKLEKNIQIYYNNFCISIKYSFYKTKDIYYGRYLLLNSGHNYLLNNGHYLLNNNGYNKLYKKSYIISILIHKTKYWTYYYNNINIYIKTHYRYMGFNNVIYYNFIQKSLILYNTKCEFILI